MDKTRKILVKRYGISINCLILGKYKQDKLTINKEGPMDFLAKWINPIFAVLLWVVVFVLIKPKRVLELLPIGIIAAILLFTVQVVLIFTKPN